MSSVSYNNSSSLSLEEKISFLKVKDNYPEHPAFVENRETHMSWVFLTPDFVYKLKKPVLYPYLNFSTLDRRKRFCEAELKLNKSLAETVYIGLIPLYFSSQGQLSFQKNGEVAEWLVKMKRLPENCMLDKKLAAQQADRREVEEVTSQLVNFYKKQAPVCIHGRKYSHRLKKEIRDYLGELKDPLYRMSPMEINNHEASLQQYIHTNESLIASRALRIIEGHGDLRPEHICLSEHPVIIDRLEFSRKLRMIDPAEELAYLAMECEILKAAWVEEIIFSVYRNESGDDLHPELILFYKSIRAIYRSLLSFRHLKEQKYRDEEKWLLKGNLYFQYSKKYIRNLNY